MPIGRIDPAVEFVVEKSLTDCRGYARTRMLRNECRCGGRDIGDVVRPQRVTQGLPQRLADLIAGAKRAAERELVIRRVEVILLVGLEDIEAGDDVAVDGVRVHGARSD